MRKFILLFISVIFCASVAISQQPYKVFLMAGQSNMAGTCGNDQDPERVEIGNPDENIKIKVFGTANYGWGPLKAGLGSVDIATGPELTFGHDMADYYKKNNKILIIKGAWSGTDLYERWRSPSAGGKTGDLYLSFVQNVKSALAEINVPYEIVGMCWLQGESDCFNPDYANAYLGNLTHFIADIRKEFNEPDLYFSIAKIMEDPAYTHNSVVRKAQQTIADIDPLTGIFDPADLPISGGHWITTACGVIGHSFAENMISLIEESKKVGMAYSPWFPPTGWNSCTWGMPQLGAYRSDDIAVIDQHIEWLADAGVDFIQLDWSNNIDYLPGCNCNAHLGMIEDASDVLIDRIVWRKKNGLSWIKIVVMIGGCGNAAYTDGRMDKKTQNVKERYLDNPDRRSVYYEHRGKPLLVDYCNGSSNYVNWNHAKFDSTFTVRHMWATLVQGNLYNKQTMRSTDGLWSWSENVHPMAYSFDGRPECATVHAALRTCGWMTPADSTLYPEVVKGMKDCFNQWGGAKGRRNGATLRESFQYARQYNVDLAMVMAFNEWTGCEGSFGEQRNPEFSIDIEPMEGGHGDQYLKILKEEVAKFKGYCILDTITFEPVGEQVSDSVFTIKATSESGIPVQFEVFSGPATIKNDVVTLTKSSGKVVIRGFHIGDNQFCSGDAYLSFEIKHTCFPQVISFDEIEDRLVGRDTIKLNASSVSKLPVGFRIVSGPAVLIDSTTIQLTGQRGDVILEASQSGNFTWCEAAKVVRKFKVFLPPHECNCEGYATYERWNDIIGGTVDLIPVNEKADFFSTVTKMDMPRNVGDDYGAKISGYLCAPFSGEYTFYIASDDGGQFWLSNSTDKTGKKLIAFVDGWTPPENWHMSGPQKSEPLMLTGGEKYYIEALLKEFKGGDHLSVRWTGPNFMDEIISGDFLDPVCLLQTIKFETTCKQVGDSLFKISASSTSGLPVKFEILSGPAVIKGDTIKMTASRGRVVVKGTQSGNNEFCEALPVNYAYVLSVSDFTSVGKINSFSKIEIYPNPANEMVYIRIPNEDVEDIKQVKVFDITGKLTWVQTTNFESVIDVAIKEYESGMYLFQIITSNGIVNHKILKE